MNGIHMSKMTLDQYFRDHPQFALGFSGGVDSSFLFASAMQAGVNVHAYFLEGPFQAGFEGADARRLAEEIAASDRLTILHADVLSDEDITSNPWNRCYYCKRKVFTTISDAARRDGYTLLVDGTNASDDVSDRPGMRALAELSVESPLRLCGLTKADIRRGSKELGLFTWNKPSNACLATRIPTNEPITQEKLTRIDRAEDALRSLGFRDLRVRKRGEIGLIQLPRDQHERALQLESEIRNKLDPYFHDVALDLNPR